jgi:hypothetical protein
LDYIKVIIEHVIEGVIEVTGRRGRIRKQLLRDLKGPRKKLEIERGCTRSQWKSVWIFRKTDYVMMKGKIVVRCMKACGRVEV